MRFSYLGTNRIDNIKVSMLYKLLMLRFNAYLLRNGCLIKGKNLATIC